jgi:hypothetical protein
MSVSLGWGLWIQENLASARQTPCTFGWTLAEGRTCRSGSSIELESPTKLESPKIEQWGVSKLWQKVKYHGIFDFDDAGIYALPHPR